MANWIPNPPNIGRLARPDGGVLRDPLRDQFILIPIAHAQHLKRLIAYLKGPIAAYLTVTHAGIAHTISPITFLPISTLTTQTRPITHPTIT